MMSNAEEREPTGLSHIDARNQPRMVDVSEKAVTVRSATAGGAIWLNERVWALFEAGEITGPKGPVLHTARIAGTQAVKRTADWIPFCHPLPIDGCAFEFERNGEAIEARCTVRTTARTGVEMEALTGVTAALLTIYDMCKALGPEMTIGDVRLLEKTGGKADFRREKEDD